MFWTGRGVEKFKYVYKGRIGNQQQGMEVKIMAKKTEILMDEYIDALEKIKERITQAQYQVMTNANVERNILFWNIGNVILQYSQWGNKFVETVSEGEEPYRHVVVKLKRY